MSKRRFSSTGVTQFDHGRSRSARSTSPDSARKPASDSSRLTSWLRASAKGRTSDTTVSSDGPASSTPDSSNVSRTAAHTSDRARPTSQANRDAHHAGGGPCQASEVSASRRSTPPPGNTVMPPANGMPLTRRCRNTSSPTSVSLTSMTVAASFGVAGGSGISGGTKPSGRISSFGSSRTRRAYAEPPPQPAGCDHERHTAADGTGRRGTVGAQGPRAGRRRAPRHRAGRGVGPPGGGRGRGRRALRRHVRHRLRRPARHGRRGHVRRAARGAGAARAPGDRGRQARGPREAAGRAPSRRPSSSSPPPRRPASPR